MTNSPYPNLAASLALIIFSSLSQAGAFGPPTIVDNFTDPLELSTGHDTTSNQIIVTSVDAAGTFIYKGPDSGSGPWTKTNILGAGMFSLSKTFCDPTDGSCYFSYVDSTDAGGSDCFVGRWDNLNGFLPPNRVTSINNAGSCNLAVMRNSMTSAIEDLGVVVYDTSDLSHSLYLSVAPAISITTGTKISSNAGDAIFGFTRAGLAALGPKWCAYLETLGAPNPATDPSTQQVICADTIGNVDPPIVFDTRPAPAALNFQYRSEIGSFSIPAQYAGFVDLDRGGNVILSGVNIAGDSYVGTVGTAPLTQNTMNFRGTSFALTPLSPLALNQVRLLAAWPLNAVAVDIDLNPLDIMSVSPEPFFGGFPDGTGPLGAAATSGIFADGFESGDVSAWSSGGSVILTLYGPAATGPMPPTNVPSLGSVALAILAMLLGMLGRQKRVSRLKKH